MKKKLQVFVSSTYKDLISERQAAVLAILKADHIPAGMELFTAGDISQMKTIERWIDESDVYMLILGGRYGSIEPTTKLSYVELEYDYAKRQGKPFFAVVIREEALEFKVKNTGIDALERSNPKELALFRDKVLSSISSFFSDEKDIRLCVYESLSDLATNPKLKGWIAADEVEDSKMLIEEVKRLRDENERLVEKLQQANRVKSSTPAHNEELYKVLEAIEVNVPADVAKTDEDITVSLFNVAFSNKDTLINGVTNAYNSSKTELFYYYNILPKLQTHGLADNEKVPGVKYRRSFLNKVGQAFFAFHEMKSILT